MAIFNVQFYQLLRPAPANKTDVILAGISAQLESFQFNPPFVNSTRSAFDSSSQPPFKAPLYAILLNALWFTSLVFSVASATIGIIVKQWLKECSTGLHGTSRDVARRRQYRYDNLHKWHVATIVAAIPVLLLIAATLFLAGLLVLLYNVHDIVAYVVSVFVGFLLLFVTLTTVVPAFSRSCCYYSPQVWTVFALINGPSFVLRGTLTGLVACLYPLSCWLTDRPKLGRLFWGFHQYIHTLKKDTLTRWRFPCVWRGGEVFTKLEDASLDINILVTAYSATLDVAALDNALSALSDYTNYRTWSEYVAKLETAITNRSGPINSWPWADADRFWRAVGNTLLLFTAHTLARNTDDPSRSHDTGASVEKFAEDNNFLRPAGRIKRVDIKTVLQALKSMSRKDDVANADSLWAQVMSKTGFCFSDPMSCKIGAFLLHIALRGVLLTSDPVAAAAAHRLRSFVQNPLLGSPHGHRNVNWELCQGIYIHLSVFRPVMWIEAGEAFADVRSLAADALRSVQQLLLEMDWNSPERNLGLESLTYSIILDTIGEIHQYASTRDLITPRLIETLAIAFSRLTGEDDWKKIVSGEDDSSVQRCKGALAGLLSDVGLESRPGMAPRDK